MQESHDAPIDETRAEQTSAGNVSRRRALVWASRIGMTAGLVAAYGSLAAFMGRYLFPSRPASLGWMFVTDMTRLRADGSLRYLTPAGASVNITHRGQSATGSPDVVALSSVCPHLGCQVHWQADQNQFYCPCHGGVFDPNGVATAGPPADAGQSLPQYALKVDSGLLFIEVSLDEIAMGPGRVLDLRHAPPGPGHDPCLYDCTGCVSETGVSETGVSETGMPETGVPEAGSREVKA